MNNEEFKKIMEGNQIYPLPVADYCNAIADEKERNEIAFYYSICQYTIDFICGIYKHENEKPILYADPYKKISATASIGKIKISRGVFDHAKECVPNKITHPKLKLLNIFSLKDGNFFSELIVFWIVAHEYFHCYNGHVELKKNYPELMIGFEYDADCSATAALYRYIEHKFGYFLNKSNIKELALYPIFWCVRIIIGEPLSETKKIETHPSWHLRMYYLIGKLSAIDVPNPNYGMTHKFMDSMKKLLTAAFNCENYYQIKKGNISKDNLINILYSNMAAVKDPEHRSVMDAWNKVIPLVISYNKRTSGIIFKHFPHSYSNPQYKTLYGKKFKHHYKETYTSNHGVVVTYGTKMY